MFGLGGTTSYDLGTADVIGGATNDLILAGSAVIDGGTFDLNNAGAGTYRLINTGGEGSIAVGEYALLNAAEGSRIYTTGNGRYLNVQVGAISTQYWDGGANAGNGAVEGGTGVWTNALGQTNWTGAAGALNNSWQGTINPPVTAVFAGDVNVSQLLRGANFRRVVASKREFFHHDEERFVATTAGHRFAFQFGKQGHLLFFRQRCEVAAMSGVCAFVERSQAGHEAVLVLYIVPVGKHDVNELMHPGVSCTWRIGGRYDEFGDGSDEFALFSSQRLEGISSLRRRLTTRHHAGNDRQRYGAAHQQANTL